MLAYAPRLKLPARRLRGEMSDAKRILWHRLRRKRLHGVQAYRQKPLGDYVVDFYLPAAHLVVEVDGSQHLTPEAMAKDNARTRALERKGLQVLRFNNLQVLLETEAVVEVIWNAIGQVVNRR